MADADSHIPTSSQRENPYHLIRVIMDPQRLSEPILQGIDGVIAAAVRTDSLQVTQFLRSIDMPGIT